MNTSQSFKPRFAASVERPAARPRLNSQELFRHSNEIVIEHHGEEYRLRLTRNDKLILNK